MNVRHSIVMLFFACLMPRLAIAGEGQLVSNAVPSQAWKGNLLGMRRSAASSCTSRQAMTAPARRYPVVYLLHGNN